VQATGKTAGIAGGFFMESAKEFGGCCLTSPRLHGVLRAHGNIPHAGSDPALPASTADRRPP
jgi:hypothetical protein